MKLRFYCILFSKDEESKKYRKWAKNMLILAGLPVPKENETEEEFFRRMAKTASKRKDPIAKPAFYAFFCIFGPFILALLYCLIIKVFG
ncbi:hypothetical protein J7L36_02320 [bacterium]|nr:hypothetical protein [bacterium]